MITKTGLLLAATLLLAACAPRAHALSWPLCADGGQVWVTERPMRGPQYPGADLWYFCDGALNILGDSVDPCVNSGSLCTPAVNDAICRFLGYDKSWGDSVSSLAAPNEVVRSLTGEFCLREGVYSTVKPDNITDLPGQPCMRVDQIVCIRTIERMASELQDILYEVNAMNTTHPELAPAAELPVVLPPPLAGQQPAAAGRAPPPEP